MNTPLCRASDPITSFMAADRVHEFQQDHCTRILAALKRMGQAGAEQIAALTSLDAYQVRKRLSDLQKRDLVQPYQKTRRTSTGRQERLWIAL
jgi:predicted ArsR family transcriptional regulator